MSDETTAPGDDLKEQIRERYADRARAVTERQSSPTCGCGCCGPAAAEPDDQSRAASTAPTRPPTCPRRPCWPASAAATPRPWRSCSPGEVVLDLGSGGGIDVLLSARRVGPTGKAYGLDMTDEMLALARENQRKAGVDQRRVPQGRDRGRPAARRLGRRHHQQLRHQPLARQGQGAGRGVPRAQAGRPLRRVRHRLPRRSLARAGRDHAQRRGLGRLHRRRARGARLPGAPADAPALPMSQIEVTRDYGAEYGGDVERASGVRLPDGVTLVGAFMRATRPRD